MNRKVILSYDGSFDGFLCCIFAFYEEKIDIIDFQERHEIQSGIFAEIQEIFTDNQKAQRVWKGIKKRTTPASAHNLYRAFLSELPGIELQILNYLRYAFNSTLMIDSDFSNKYVLKIAKTAKMVGREKHRMEAFVRFQLTKDNIFYAGITPDFNVLPLISSHFEKRYADQQWIIYDLQRHYGLFYNLNNVELINLDFIPNLSSKEGREQVFDPSELEFQQLWKNYFEATNIKSRVNIRLHLQHVPKRYWKYLSEKNPLLN